MVTHALNLAAAWPWRPASGSCWWCLAMLAIEQVLDESLR